MVRDIPVANGKIKQGSFPSPNIFSASLAIEQVSLEMRLEPAAFGWIANRSPDLPMPWDK